MRSSPHRFLAATIILFGCAAPPEPPTPSPAKVSRAPAARSSSTVNYSVMEREIIHLVNLERAKNRLDTLVWNPALDKAAKIQALEMAAERKMAHELPGAPYPALKDRIHFVGYSYRHLAENIAYGYPDAANTVGAWMKSAGHRANILDRAVVETGVGVARSKMGELYYCQVFGARLY